VKRAVALPAVAIALLFICSNLFSQTNQGSIQGAVLDQSGGAIAGAMVTVIDVSRGLSRALTTDSAGQYVANDLNPGTYTVRAEAKGFQALEHSGVLVEVGQTVRVDMTVQPGEQTQTVTVTGEVPAINASDATLGGTVSNQSINALPLNGRNFERLIQLRPGVVTSVGAGSGTAVTNGLRGTANMFRMEGIAGVAHTVGSSLLNNAYRGGDTSSLVPIDAIQEFSSEQNPKAEYGWKDGSVVNVGIKSGTNSIHGTAYAFGRDASATDASNFFTNSVTPASLEQFGATVGGPVLKDKLFWFASFEGLRSTVGQTATTTIPSDVAMSAAVDPTKNLSLVDACNAVGSANINPLSARLVGLNPATCTVSPMSSTFENIFPFNSCGSSTACNSYAPGIDSTLPLNNGLFKGDYVLGTHHHISGTFYESKSTQYSAGSAVVFNSGTIATQLAKQISGDWTWTLGSSMVNDFRLGYIYVVNNTIDPDTAIPSDPWPQGYGMPTGVTNPLYSGLPLITIGSFSPLGFLNGRPSHGGAQGDVNLVETLSYLRGKHAFKYGFEFLDMVFDLNVYPAAEGTAVFSTTQTFLQGLPNSGSIYLGNPEATNRSHWYSGFVQDDWRITPRLTLNAGLRYEYYTPPIEVSNHIGTFDPNVTGNAPAVQRFGPGLPISQSYDPGWGYFSPRLGGAWDVRGNGKTVVRAAGGMLRNGLFMGTMIPTAPWGANFPSLGVNNSGTEANQFTAARIALGACTSVPCAGWNWNTTGPVFPTSNTAFAFGGQNYTGVSCAPTGSITGVPICQTGGIDPNFQQAYTAEWNVDIQQAITNKLTLDVAYVGNHGVQQEYLSDLNQPPIGTGWNTPWTAAQLTAAKQNTGDAGLTSAQLCLGQGPVPFCTVNTAAERAAGQYSALFPYLSNIDIAGTQGGGLWSNYNGLQVTLQARNYHGLSFLTGYTYSHALSVTDGNSTNNGSALLADRNNPRLNYGNNSNDQRHRLTFSPTYQLPGMKAPAQMLEGWTLNGILTLQSGLAWNPSDPTVNDWLGTGENTNSGIGAGTTQFWNYSGPRSAFSNTGPTPIPCYGKLAGCTAFAAAPADIQASCNTAAQAPYAGNAQLQQLALVAMGNQACYVQGGGVLTPPAYGTLGNASRGLFSGPHYYNVDFGVAKLWKFKERYSAQFRVEFFNLFNRADFTNPSGTTSTDPTKPSTFDHSINTPDSANPVLGSGGPRHIQFGLKLAF